MNAKRNLVSFLLIASVLFLAASVSAIAVTPATVTIDGVDFDDNPAVIAGETITVKVWFTADVDASEVVIKAELGDETAKNIEGKFDIENGESYKKVLKIKVPYDFDDDELSTEMDFEIEISADDEADEYILEDELLTVQRPSYNVEIKPVHIPSSVEAGEKFSVDLRIENTGYNDLDDLYLTATCPELEIDEGFYIGDLTDIVEDDESSVHKVLRLEVPYDAQAGEYILQISVSDGDDEVVKKDALVVVTENSLPNQVIKTEDGLIIVNPTDKVAVYTVESTANVEPSTVVVEAGSSAKVTVTANTDSEFSVSVFSATGELIDTVNFSGSAQSEEFELTSPVFMLTVILAVVFLVLLVVLIVLITKKPQKAEEFGESYY